MKAPKGFKYSPNGYTILQVAEGEPMCEAAAQAAIDLGLVKKGDITRADKAEREEAKAAAEKAAAEKLAQEEAEAKSTGPDANKATGPDSNKSA
jgi:hypothetical protein